MPRWLPAQSSRQRGQPGGNSTSLPTSAAISPCIRRSSREESRDMSRSTRPRATLTARSRLTVSKSPRCLRTGRAAMLVSASKKTVPKVSRYPGGSGLMRPPTCRISGATGAAPNAMPTWKGTTRRGAAPAITDEAGVPCAAPSLSGRRWRARAFGSLRRTGWSEGLHQAGDRLVECLDILIGAGEHHAALEPGEDLKGPGFPIGPADSPGQVLDASAEERQYFIGDFGR
jgi:hypothetical protein